MWNIVDRVAKTVSDLTIGTVIVLVHVTLAERESERRRQASRVLRGGFTTAAARH